MPLGFVYAVRASSPIQKHFNVGAFLGEQSKGLGYGPAAVALFLRYLFQNFDIPKAVFEIYGWNAASLKATSHFPQFRLEGVRERHIFWAGEFFELYEFGLSREDFSSLMETPFWKRMIG